MLCYDTEARLLFASEKAGLLASQSGYASMPPRAEWTAPRAPVSRRADRGRRRRQARPEAEARLRRTEAAEAARS